jgi:hypothetical protein
VFIVFGGLSVLLQIIFIITLHTSFDQVVKAVQNYSNVRCVCLSVASVC